MPIEIERKFLLSGDGWRHGVQGTNFVQGYLSTHPERSVRVRIAGPVATLTIKGRTTGASRAEFEYEIPVPHARQMLEQLCQTPIIDKTRYLVPHRGHTWEIDVFHGLNSGLVVAEVELRDEQEAVVLPPWVGEEVTGQRAYYNANLIRHPFSSWPGGTPS